MTQERQSPLGISGRIAGFFQSAQITPLLALLCALIGRYRLSYLCDIPPLQSLREMNQ